MFASEHVYMHMFSRIVVHILFMYSNVHMFIESRAVYTLVLAHMDTYAHIHTNICTRIHTCTLVHTGVNAQMWDLVRKAMYSETRWNQNGPYSPNSLSCKGFLRWWEKGFRSKLAGASAFGDFLGPISPTLIYMQICINGEDRPYCSPIKLGEQ